MTPLEEHGFLRLASVSPKLHLANPQANATEHCAALQSASEAGARWVVFPELGLTGYTCGDLFYQSSLLEAAKTALFTVAEATSYYPLAAVVGLPLVVGPRLYNVAAVLCGGDIVGIIPKTELPCAREFYETRYFSSARTAKETHVNLGSVEIPFGSDILFELENITALNTGARATFGVEICEDLWSPQAPSSAAALGGALVLSNLSASNATLGKRQYRQQLVCTQSAKTISAYVYASAGCGESSAETVFRGPLFIAENGRLLTEGNPQANEALTNETRMATADVNLRALAFERLHAASFSQTAGTGTFRTLPLRIREAKAETDAALTLQRPISQLPFIPHEASARAATCQEVFSIQCAALRRRLEHTGAEKIVLGVSGGLDSALAALVAAKTLQNMGRPAEDLLCALLPGPGSSQRTQTNARTLAQHLGASTHTADITQATTAQLSEINHPKGVHDVTFENVQARYRTQLLFNLANQQNGLMLGTSDLSEAALGWCTYGGDHISGYHINIGVPKTLVQHIVSWHATTHAQGTALESILNDINATPITPELIPGNQATEENIGPYILHDFFLYHHLRRGAPKATLMLLAQHTFSKANQNPQLGNALTFEKDFIEQTLETFTARFKAAQFKRNAMPDGPKIGTVALGQRSDWRMPSDVL